MSDEHQHPTVDVYLRVAAALVILTVLEVGVFYVPAFHPVLVPVLLVLSAAKFALVVMFYMHLKADNKFFTFLFGHTRQVHGDSSRAGGPVGLALVGAVPSD